MRRLLPLACLLALVLAPSAVAQVPAPTATTAPANPIGRDTATVRGTVNTNGVPTVYRFEYGETTSYGSVTADHPLPAGASIDVSEGLSGLKEGTVYHYRLIAWPASDPTAVASGGDRWLRTLEPPSVTTGTVRDTHADRTVLLGRLDPNRSQTRWHFEWGLTKGYGQRTPELDAGHGSTSLQASAPIAGLQPNTVYNYRLVATSAGGTTYGKNRSFRTLRQPTGITISAPLRTVGYGGDTVVAGTVQGAGVAGIRVALEAQPFPFRGGWQPAGNTVITGSDGSFRLVSPPLWITTRLHVVAKSAVSAVSAPITVLNRLLVTAHAQRLAGRRVRVEGLLTPRVRGVRVALQRRGAHGKWRSVRRTRAARMGRARYGYRFTINRERRARVYRVVATPPTGAYVRATSGTLRIAKARKR
jgi:hypothetical protein